MLLDTRRRNWKQKKLETPLSSSLGNPASAAISTGLRMRIMAPQRCPYPDLWDPEIAWLPWQRRIKSGIKVANQTTLQ